MGIGNFFKTLFGNAKEAKNLIVESNSQFSEEATDKAKDVAGKVIEHAEDAFEKVKEAADKAEHIASDAINEKAAQVKGSADKAADPEKGAPKASEDTLKEAC